MSSVRVEKVELLANGQVAVTPAVAKDSFQYIYRAAAGVEWVATEGRFLSPSRYMLGAPFPLSSEQRFKNLASAAASEMGIILQVTSNTEWVAVPEEMRRTIEAEFSA